MNKKRIVYFFVAIFLLIVSEYVFLDELLYNNRPLQLFLSGLGISISIYFIIRFYKEWRSVLK